MSRQNKRTTVETALSGAALGFPLWALFSVVILPAMTGHRPGWSLAGIRNAHPQLIQWVIFGALVAVLLKLVDRSLRSHLFANRKCSRAERRVVRVVVVGGGFGGMNAALHLEAAFAREPAVELTLISQTNALLFTPMLAEVAASSIEASHISTPARALLDRTTVLRATVRHIDVEARQIMLSGDDAGVVPYDHVVLALGAVSNYLGMKDVEDRAFGFKTMVDAIRIRNHVIDMFERAERSKSDSATRRLLTFVVAGAGFAGAEIAGALNDFAHGMLVDYPHVAPESLRVILVHAHDRILEELSAPLSAYALSRMASRGITFKLGARVASAPPGEVVLDTGERVPTETLVWTAGSKPHPLLQSLDLCFDKRGAVIADETLRVKGTTGVWALGDCASVFDAHTGRACAPTAQTAVQQAKRLAMNVHASIHGKALLPFRHQSMGSMCVVGHQTACAEIRLPFSRHMIRFSGFSAWLLWRATYLSKLPGTERRIRVLFDWLIELFFPRDLAQTIELE